MTKKIKLLAIVIVLVILATPIAVKTIDSQNAKSKKSQIIDPIRVACVGDSITAISGYPAQLQSKLGDNYQVGNFGVVGSTVARNSWKSYMAQPEFQSAMDFQPDIVIIILGTNDDLSGARQYSDSFQDDYSTLINSFQTLDSQPDVWIGESPPIFSNSTDLSPSYMADTIIPKTADLADQLNLPVIDLYTPLGDHPDYFVDGVHPNDLGTSLIVGQVYDSLDSQYDLNTSS